MTKDIAYIIFLCFIALPFIYLIIRLASLAFFKSWIEFLKERKEESNVTKETRTTDKDSD
uniref:Uncharacterized protein n=1 Tax=viral metagenome TaxID=1070528 RepID=A0A6M3L4D5_9ZZZZ